jgi:hypothetical protein
MSIHNTETGAAQAEHLRAELARLRSCHADGPPAPGIDHILKLIEIEISWSEHRAGAQA